MLASLEAAAGPQKGATLRAAPAKHVNDHQPQEAQQVSSNRSANSHAENDARTSQTAAMVCRFAELYNAILAHQGINLPA